MDRAGEDNLAGRHRNSRSHIVTEELAHDLVL
jgi:hypothetical protein